ncbi:hypothetical protein [Balneatrix alpica]|uniref:Uncharacterized protein n=1 Tax=Balneatrix alpica TaxID=75684 RepID=A0ABV5ZEG5_9GAMM|nr:hypothetical protein [Balneatrix alpica]
MAQVIEYSVFLARRRARERERRMEWMRARFARAMGMDPESRPPQRPSPRHHPFHR